MKRNKEKIKNKKKTVATLAKQYRKTKAKKQTKNQQLLNRYKQRKQSLMTSTC